MKRLIFLLCLLSVYLSSSGQAPVLNNVVRTTTLSPAKVANALDALKVFTATGTDIYTITPNLRIYDATYVPGWTYASGDIFKVTFSNTNTSTTTSLDVNGEGAIAMKDSEGNDLAIGSLKVGAAYQFYYNGATFRMIGSSLTLANGSGTTANGSSVNLGGTLTSTTTINTGANNVTFSGNSVFAVDGDAVSLSANTGGGSTRMELGNQSIIIEDQVGSQFKIEGSSTGLELRSPVNGNFDMTFNSSGMVVTDNRGTKEGIEYAAAGYVTQDRSLTDRGYVLGAKTYTGTQTFAGTSFPTAPTLSDGIKWVFNPSGTNAGFNVGAHTAAPSSLTNGDLWYNSTANTLTARINGTSVDLGTGGGGGDALTTNPLSQFAATTSSELAGVISNETGSGLLVFGTSPTLVTPAIGTPSSGIATNITGLPLTTGVTGTLPVANGGTGTTSPGIVAGTNITVTGTWPNQTVNSSGGGSSALSGLTAATGTNTINNIANQQEWQWNSLAGGNGFKLSSSSTAAVSAGTLFSTGLGTIANGTGYTAGTYTVVPLTGGTGTGAQATIQVYQLGYNVSATGIVGITITNAGTGYLSGDVLSCSNTNVGGTGSGFTVTVNQTQGNHTLLNNVLTGANSNTGLITNTAILSNTKTGTQSTNVGLRTSASGATNNYAIQIPSGEINTTQVGKILSIQAVDGNIYGHFNITSAAGSLNADGSTDPVVMMGWNTNGNGGPENAKMPAHWYSWERRYMPFGIVGAAQTNFEHHYQMTGNPIISGFGVITAGTAYTNGVYRNVALTGGAGINATATITVAGGAVTLVEFTNNGLATLSAPNGGSAYTNGTYNNVSLTGGTGTGAKAIIVVSAGAVSSVTITGVNTYPGRNYLANDILSAASANIGGTGTGFTILVNSVASSSPGSNYLSGDVLSASAANIGGTGSGFSVPVSGLTNPGTRIFSYLTPIHIGQTDATKYYTTAQVYNTLDLESWTIFSNANGNSAQGTQYASLQPNSFTLQPVNGSTATTVQFASAFVTSINGTNSGSMTALSIGLPDDTGTFTVSGFNAGQQLNGSGSNLFGLTVNNSKSSTAVNSGVTFQLQSTLKAIVEFCGATNSNASFANNLVNYVSPSTSGFTWFNNFGVAAYLSAKANFQIGTVNVVTDAARLYVKDLALTSAWLPVVRFDAAPHTGMTASTSFPDLVFNGASQTWGSGTIAIQPKAWIKGNTFNGTSGTNTATIAAGLQVDPYIIGTNSAITNNYSIYSTGKIGFDQTITTAGTTGNQTINKPAGTVNIAAAGTTVTVTNSLCTTSSSVIAVIRTNDATAVIKNVVPGAGSFVITLSASSTAEISIYFEVKN